MTERPGGTASHDVDRHRAANAPVIRRALKLRAARKSAWWLSKAFYRGAERFIFDDGLYMASALAFAIILAIFPFIIFLTALAGVVGGEQLASLLRVQLFDVLPDQVAETLEPEIYNVLIRDPGGGILTFGLAFTVISVSSAIETVRGGLNRAYGVVETRNVVRTRLESILFVLLTTVALALVGLVSVVMPIIYNAIVAYVPEHIGYSELVGRLRLAITGSVLAILLWALHRYLPAWRHGARPPLWPGIVVTLVLWYLGATLFSLYLQFFANYTRIYAGLAGIVAAMIFFYVASTILLFAGAFNRAIGEAWAKRKAERALRALKARAEQNQRR